MMRMLLRFMMMGGGGVDEGGGERQREAAGGDVNAGFLCYILATNCEPSQPGPEQGWIYVVTLVPCLIALSA